MRFEVRLNCFQSILVSMPISWPHVYSLLLRNSAHCCFYPLVYAHDFLFAIFCFAQQYHHYYFIEIDRIVTFENNYFLSLKINRLRQLALTVCLILCNKHKIAYIAKNLEKYICVHISSKDALLENRGRFVHARTRHLSP